MNNKEENQLKRRKIRPTAMRILVLQYLTNLGRTTSLSDLESQFDYADKSTLFRTLKTFEEKGVIHKIDDGTGIVKYGLCAENCNCLQEEQHFHFNCEMCKETYCLTSLHVPALKIPSKFIVKQANLVLKGVCANCN